MMYHVGDSLYEPATDDEKAAALEAAIEFEDRIVATANERQPAKGWIMDETTSQGVASSPLDEMVELAARMKADHARLVELCKEIYLANRTEAASPQAGELAGRPAAVAGRGRRARRTAPAGEKKYWEPKVKVVCLECGGTFGSVRVGTKHYPYNHTDPTTKEPCKGVERPAPLQGAGDGGD
jgi:hypothetical protein